MVAGRFPGRVTLLVGESATRTAVLAAMRGHRRIHLACHAVADLDHPSQSALLLAGSPLTAADLGNLRLADADSAFLSACETARTGPVLSDEAVHLASALLVAGYREVVATLWPVPDRPALRLSRAVYDDPASRTGAASTAAAVHRAVGTLRRRYPRSPFAWASQVHIGR